MNKTFLVSLSLIAIVFLISLLGMFSSVNHALNEKPIINERMTLVSSNKGISVWKFVDPRTGNQYIVVQNGTLVQILTVPSP